MNGGHLGLIALEATLQILAQCVNGSLVATAPASAPSFSVYGTDGTALLTGSLGASDHDTKTGLRRGTAAITAANGFAVGNIYYVRVGYTISATDYAIEYSFNVV